MGWQVGVVVSTAAVIGICAGLALVAFFLWATIHELSHLVAAKLFVDAELTCLKVWPHVHNGVFYWASIRYHRNREATRTEETLINLAPRVPGAAAAVAFPFTALLPSPWCWFVGVLVGAALVDIAVGSIGYNVGSDARRAAAEMRISVWWVRIIGWTAVLTSAAAWAVVMAGSRLG